MRELARCLILRARGPKRQLPRMLLSRTLTLHLTYPNPNPTPMQEERPAVCTVYYAASSCTMAFAMYTVYVASFAT